MEKYQHFPKPASFNRERDYTYEKNISAGEVCGETGYTRLNPTLITQVIW